MTNYDLENQSLKLLLSEHRSHSHNSVILNLLNILTP